MEHLIVLPACAPREVRWQHTIVDCLAGWARRREFAQPRRFWLALTSDLPLDPTLAARLGRLGEVEIQICPSRRRTYHVGPTTLFWETAGAIARRGRGDRGFFLWLEPDAVPGAADWYERLDRSWRAAQGGLDLLGQHVTQLPEHLGGGNVPPHFNGVACYALDFAARFSPPADCDVPFDWALAQPLRDRGRTAATGEFRFAAPAEAPGLIHRGAAAVLHGMAQDKPAFLAAARAAVLSQTE